MIYKFFCRRTKLNWIELDWIRLNWIGLHWIERDVFSLNLELVDSAWLKSRTNGKGGLMTNDRLWCSFTLSTVKRSEPSLSRLRRWAHIFNNPRSSVKTRSKSHFQYNKVLGSPYFSLVRGSFHKLFSCQSGVCLKWRNSNQSESNLNLGWLWVKQIQIYFLNTN